VSPEAVHAHIHIPAYFRNDSYAERCFSRIAAWAAEQHPFYQRLYTNPERSIPLLTRTEIQRHEKEFLNGHTVTGRTSGSTGEPVSVAWNEKRAQIEKRDSYAYLKHLGGELPTARILSVSAHRPAPNIFEITKPTEQQIEFIIQQHLSKGAVALTTYPSNIELLCHHILVNKLDFSFIQRVGCMSELFEEHHEQLIKKAFPRASIWTSYSCVEMGIVALRCPYNPRYHHIMSHKIGVEVLDDEGLACADGQQGKLVLTDYMNTQSPYIRYDIGDRAARAHCDCGRINMPALQDIVGKVTGTYLLADGRRVLFNNLKVAFRSLPMLAQFQLVQEAVDDFTLYFILRDKASAGGLQSLAQDIVSAQVGPAARINCVAKNESLRTAAGKLQATFSRV
jgi:phenylacetate-CoA ligase